MKPLLFIMFSLFALLTGCNHIPAVTADKIVYDSSYPIGGTNITIIKPEVTDTKIKAGSYKRVSKWGWFSQTVEIENYSRNRTTKDDKAIEEGAVK